MNDIYYIGGAAPLLRQQAIKQSLRTWYGEGAVPPNK